MSARKELTPEQVAARDARRAKFRELWQQVAKMPELERVQLANKYGFRNVEGHEFSLVNSILLALQAPAGSIFGGFRQWMKQGRSVRKGEHGSMIWVPIGVPKGNDPQSDETVEASEATDRRFIIGTVFDISQTEQGQ